MKKIMLTRVQPKFVQLVRAIMDSQNLTQKQLAQILDIPEPNLSNLMKIDPDTGLYKRKLSNTYLSPFFKKRLIKVPEIFDGKPETDRETRYWKSARVIQDDEMADLIADLEDDGVDVKAMLKAYRAGLKSKK